MARAAIAILRLGLLALLLVLGLLLALAMLGDFRNGVPGRGLQGARRCWLRCVVRAVGVSPRRHGEPVNEPALWVANHISWLDIPVIGSVARVGFLSKAEVGRWPVIGFLARRGGTLFIERGRRNAADGVARLIARHIQGGHSVLVFPEGTTTPGQDVRRFHARLLGPAIEHDFIVQPVALRYRDARHRPSEAVPFVDGVTLMQSVWRTLTAKNLVVDIDFLPPLRGRDFEERKKLAARLESDIRSRIIS
ncbi:MAG TPA: 1-acyl-sn-glycerol-3-phosphate acyltransferase [Gammaproteobacteria bacterium]|nr:1-acyl-sn-glycerol-3-phosphate acyltransferase [Gammaproteobacteria bacterium]